MLKKHTFFLYMLTSMGPNGGVTTSTLYFLEFDKLPESGDGGMDPVY